MFRGGGGDKTQFLVFEVGSWQDPGNLEARLQVLGLGAMRFRVLRFRFEGAFFVTQHSVLLNP